ncbi:MAG: PQQ-binding-like beta-propeller repeat protein [Planctomycetota bacterium]
MSASQLLDRIEQTGLVDSKTLTRLRKEVDSASNPLKAKAVAKYLVDKGLMTQAQIDRLLEKAYAGAPAGKTKNTDELLNLGGAPAPARPTGKGVTQVVPVEADAGATRVFGMDEVVELDEVVEVPVEAQLPIGLDDPLLGGAPAGAGGLFGETVAAERPTRETGSTSFRGKIDSSNQWQTKWLFIAFGLLAVLGLIGSVLYLSLSGESAENLFKMAETSFNQTAYLDAAKKYNELYTKFPGNEKADYAKVKEVQALLAGPHERKNFNEVLTIAKEHLDRVLNLKELDAVRGDLALMLTNSILAESEAALKKPSNAEMAEATKKVEAHIAEFVDRDIYIPGNIKKTPAITALLEKLTNNVKLLNGSIKKEDDYVKSLADIKSLTEKSETDRAFEVFNTLVRTYGDMGSRTELRNAMKEVSAKEIGLVKPSDLSVTAETSAPASAVARQVLLYSTSRDRAGDKPAAESAEGQSSGESVPSELRSLADDTIPVLAEGAVFGVNAGDGSLQWRHFVGYETTYQPQWTERIQKKNLILCDQREHAVSCVDGQSGALLWRSVIGQPFLNPTVVDETIYIATRSGVIMRLDPYTGKKMAATQLPKKLLAPVERAEGIPYIYAVAEDANLYVLSAEDLSCAEVFYIGHFPGSVTQAPLFWSGYLLVAVNGSDYCDLHVLKFAEKGLRAERAQVFRLADGPVTIPASRLGRWMLFLADNGEVKILELNTTEGEVPIRLVAEDKFENRGKDRFFMHAEGSNLWIASKGLIRYGIQRTLGKFEREKIANPSDYFLGPITKIDDYLFHLRRRDGARQVSVTAVNSQTLEEVWRTDFAAPTPAAPIASGNELAIVSAQGDAFLVDQAALDASAVRRPIKSSAIDQALNFVERVELSGNRHAFVAPAGSSDVLMLDLANRRSQVSRMQAPADSPASTPIGIGPDLLVPTSKGQVVRIDPNNGRLLGTPFQPPLRPGAEMLWNRPVQLAGGMVVIGDHQQTLYRIDTNERTALREIAKLDVDGELVSDLAAAGSAGVFVVSEAGGKHNLLKLEAVNGLTLSGTTPLEGQVVAGPWAVEQTLFLMLDDGQLHAFDLQGTALWQLDVANQQIAGIAARPGGWDVALVTGRIHRIDSAGTLEKTLEIGQPIRLAPTQALGHLIVCAADGTLLLLDPDKLSAGTTTGGSE